MVAVPAATAVTSPTELTLAMNMLLLVHAPPGVPSVSEVVAPTQSPDVPVIVEVVTALLTRSIIYWLLKAVILLPEG